jgi:hypothetical protein
MVTNDRSVIERYGRFLGPILKRISSENPAKASRIEGVRASLQSVFATAACPVKVPRALGGE